MDEYRSWALLGILACPTALHGVGVQELLAALLRETCLLPVFRCGLTRATARGSA